MKDMYQWNIYEAWINQVEGIGRQKMKRFEYAGTEWEALYRMERDNLYRYIKEVYSANISFAGRLGEKTVQKDCEAILQAKMSREPVKLYEEMVQKEIYYVNHRSAYFPKKLIQIPDAPYALYIKGQLFPAGRTEAVNRMACDNDFQYKSEMPHGSGMLCGGGAGSHDKLDYESAPVVAIIGARMCSEYGKYAARELGQTAAQLGIEVVSGLASGIDGIAQNAARMSQGVVTAVLGSGADVCYPKQNREIYEGILERGRIISEYPPGTQPVGQNFPPRNRIISGLADAVVVVEAKRRSGTLITVDMALEQGRDVYALPGRVTDSMSYGCNKLIAQGAECIVDVMECLLQIRDKSLHYTNCLRASQETERGVDRKSNRETGKRTDWKSSREADKRTDWENNGETDKRADKEMNGITDGEIERALMTVDDMILRAIDVHARSVQEIYEALNTQTAISLTALQNKLICMEMLGQIEEKGGRYSWAHPYESIR